MDIQERLEKALIEQIELLVDISKKMESAEEIRLNSQTIINLEKIL